MCWAEFRAGRAQWQAECWTNAEWRAIHPDAHPMLQLDGVGIQNVFPDWMHTKHLGCDKMAYASVMHVLCYELLPGTPQENVDMTWAECLAFYREHRIRDHYRHMRLSLFCKPRAHLAKFPKMRRKAIEVRNLGPPLLKIWTARMDAGSLLHQQVAYMLRCSVKLEDMLREHKALYRFPPDIALEFRATTEKYLQLTSSVARIYGESGRKLFDVTTKHHILWHCADSGSLINPAKSWCYKGEDNMLHVRRLAASSLTGTKQYRVGGKVLDKWLRGFTLRFLPRERRLANSNGARTNLLSERLVRNIRSEQIILRVEVGAEHSE